MRQRTNNRGGPRFRNQFSAGRPNPLGSPNGHDHPPRIDYDNDAISSYENDESFESKDIGKVVNGIPVRRGAVPWQALIEDMNSGEICGGSVLNRLFILTAAHCVDNYRQSSYGKLQFPKNILVILDQPEFCIDSQRGPHNSTRRVRQVYVHPRYHKRGLKVHYDAALLRVMRPMDFSSRYLKPISLPSLPKNRERENDFVGKIVEVTGYGRVESVNVRGKDQTACQTMLGHLKVMDPYDPVCAKGRVRLTFTIYRVSQQVLEIRICQKIRQIEVRSALLG